MEIELKFSIAPGDQERLRRSTPLRGVRPKRQRIETVYFDTPDCEIAAQGLALRLRRVGSRWVEGLKGGAGGTGGLHQRDEWEHVRADAGLDLSRYADTPLAAVKDAVTLHQRLAPAFRVTMTRTAWRLAPAEGIRLEVALDDGVVRAGARSDRICEVEIECLEGAPAAAFELASRLLEEVSLRPSATSKAQRGYRLFRGEPLQPVKARQVELAGIKTPAGAARKVLGAGLDQLHANEEGLLVSADPEFVHQARIALRRLRAALRIFSAPIGEQRARAWRNELGDVARALGAARDWDVFATEALPPILAAYEDRALEAQIDLRVARRRTQERAAAREALCTARYARAILDISRWIAEEGANDERPEALKRFATRVLRKRHKRLIRDAADPASLTVDERHCLRIDAKRLRYGTDALASIFEPTRAEVYLGTLSDLQDALGKANDAATALRLLGELSPPRSFEHYARACIAPQERTDPALLRGLIGALAASSLWRG